MGEATYSLSATDLASFAYPPGQNGVIATCGLQSFPATFSCPQFEITQNISISSTINEPLNPASCFQRIRVYDSTLSIATCPTFGPQQTLPFPVKSCQVTIISGDGTENIKITMCTPSATDFPYLDYTDECKGDPRFGLVTPVSSSNAQGGKMDPWAYTTGYDVLYSQTQLNETFLPIPTSNTLNTFCPLTMSVLVIVSPVFNSVTPTKVTLGITYFVAWASSIQFRDFDGTNKYETEFRLYLQEKDPAPGQSPQIVNLQEIIYKTLKTTGYSTSTFNISPATPLKTDTYYLVIQGRNSGVTSVTNPVIVISS